MGRGASGRKPFSSGGPRLIVAVDDDVSAQARAAIAQTIGGHGVEIEIVPAAELSDPNSEADFYFGAYKPATPNCERVLQYLEFPGRFVDFEQDQDTGAVYRNGMQVWPTAPIAVKCVSWRPHPELSALSLEDWALLFADGERIRITTIPDVLLHIRSFKTRAPGRGESIPSDWIARAEQQLKPTDRDV